MKQCLFFNWEGLVCRAGTSIGLLNETLSIISVIFQVKMGNICWFRLPKMCLFSVKNGLFLRFGLKQLDCVA